MDDEAFMTGATLCSGSLRGRSGRLPAVVRCGRLYEYATIQPLEPMCEGPLRGDARTRIRR